jgi:hypothetical protein
MPDEFDGDITGAEGAIDETFPGTVVVVVGEAAGAGEVVVDEFV